MSSVPESLKKVSKNSSLILGGQVISDQQTKINLPGQDTCQGDSGGPLWTEVNNRAVLIGSLILGQEKDQKLIDFPFHPLVFSLHSILGLVSRGRGCAQAHYPGIYTRVSLPCFHPITPILIVKIR